MPTGRHPLPTERYPLPITNQKIIEMAKLITERLKAAYICNPSGANTVMWPELEEEYFDWIEEQLFGKQP